MGSPRRWAAAPVRPQRDLFPERRYPEAWRPEARELAVQAVAQRAESSAIVVADASVLWWAP